MSAHSLPRLCDFFMPSTGCVVQSWGITLRQLINNWPRQILCLWYWYNIRQTSNKSKENYRLEDLKLIQYQILPNLCHKSGIKNSNENYWWDCGTEKVKLARKWWPAIYWTQGALLTICLSITRENMKWLQQELKEFTRKPCLW